MTNPICTNCGATITAADTPHTLNDCVSHLRGRAMCHAYRDLLDRHADLLAELKDVRRNADERELMALRQRDEAQAALRVASALVRTRGEERDEAQ